MKNVLITGGAGYIGSELTGFLLEAGYSVSIVDNLMYDATSLLRYASNENFSFIKGDVRDANLLTNQLAKADIVIPLAALVGFPLCERDPRGAEEINHEHVATLARLKTENQKIIYPCTNSGYGSSEDICTEESPLNPVSLYGKTKVAAEDAVKAVDNHVTFRLATVFGPSSRMRTDLLVNNFVLKALRERVLVLYECEFMRNYVHIHDVCRAFMFVIENWESCKNETYNVGNDSLNMNKLDLAKTIQTHLPLEIIQAEFTQDLDKRDYIVSNAKLEKTGWKRKFSLDYGIKELINLYSWMKITTTRNY